MVWNLNTPRTHPSNCRHLAKIQEYSCEEGAFNLAASQGQSVAWVADPRKGDLHFCEILPRSQRDLPHGGQPLPSPWGIVTMWLSTAIDCPHSKEAGGQLPPLISHCKQNLISGLSVSYSSGEKRKKKQKKLPQLCFSTYLLISFLSSATNTGRSSLCWCLHFLTSHLFNWNILESAFYPQPSL